MLVFPQLVTGAAALYPVTRVASTRTVVNVLPGGERVKYADPDWGDRVWELRASGLTRDEWDAIEALHDDARGRLHTFTLLDPVGNLLKRSEQFDEPEWDNTPLVSATGGISDPMGGTRAMQVDNGAAIPGGVVQTIDAPGNFKYSVSVWARRADPGTVSLAALTTGGGVARDFAVSGTWKRLSLFVDLGLATESMTFSVQLPAGDIAELFGMQVEVQLAPSAYRRTGAQGGVYQARFASDELIGRARGTDIYDAVIRIVSKGS